MGLFRTVGYGGDSGSIHDIENAGLVLIVGSNTAESHPVLATRVKRAHKLRGQKLIVADLREHEMARRADIFCTPSPAPIWSGSPPSAVIFSTTASRMRISCDKWVNGLRGISRRASSRSPWNSPHKPAAFQRKR